MRSVNYRAAMWWCLALADIAKVYAMGVWHATDVFAGQGFDGYGYYISGAILAVAALVVDVAAIAIAWLFVRTIFPRPESERA